MMTYKPQHYVEPVNVIEEIGKLMLADGYNFVLDLDKSEGVNLIEARNGKRYLDFFTSFASMPVGMNHPKMNQPDFIEFIGKIALNKPSNADIYTDVMASFVKTFNKVAVPSYFTHCFFIDGGALAVENALKTAFDWKVRKNFAKGIKEEKGSKIIHFCQAFHGRSGYTMSLTNTDPAKINYFPKFDWPRISNPFIKFPLNEENLADTILREKQSLKEIQKAFDENIDDIAAIIIEPIQGEGGDNHFRPEFLQALKEIAHANDALLIFDEVQSGLGITGTMWAHQLYDVIPDILAFGKKMQICGILATNKLDEVKDNVFKVSSRINSTWGGNLTDMARSMRYLEIIEEENLVENAKNMGAYLLKKIESLQAEYPEYIHSARGKGLMCAFNFVDTNSRSTFINECWEKGLIILSCGNSTVRFRPALNITAEQIDEGFDIIRQSLACIVENVSCS